MAERGRRRPGYPRLSLAAVLLAYCGIGAGGVHASSEALARSPVYEQDFEIDLETIAYQADWRLPREDGEAYVESDALRDSTVLVLERPEAGRRATRMLGYLFNGTSEGHVSFDLVLEALRIVMAKQDPETGLWGDPAAGRFQRINGAYKVFVLLRRTLDLPVPHADKIIDQVLAEMDRPDYEAGVAGCDEVDNWAVLGLALPVAGGHREAEVRDRATRRIRHIIERYRKPDGGLSYFPGVCQTMNIGFDMAPETTQGDAMGAHILVTALSVCLGLADLGDRTSWQAGAESAGSLPNDWQLDEKETRKCRRRVLEAFGPPHSHWKIPLEQRNTSKVDRRAGALNFK